MHAKTYTTLKDFCVNVQYRTVHIFMLLLYYIASDQRRKCNIKIICAPDEKNSFFEKLLPSFFLFCFDIFAMSSYNRLFIYFMACFYSQLNSVCSKLQTTSVFIIDTLHSTFLTSLT